MRSEPVAGGWSPAWAASERVGAWMSTRHGGVSAPPWDRLNLGAAVRDQACAVAENRRRFAAALGATPVWLHQVHGNQVVRLSSAGLDAEPVSADAAWTDEPWLACTVQVADCMPVLMAAPQGRAVAAAHAGWRGLAGGVLEAALEALCEGTGCTPAEVDVWLGPCIGPRARAEGTLRWLANLPQLARERLRQAGVLRVSGGEWCTVEDRSRFFSYRRDGITGRLAAAVWIRG
jgi:YfiH family protein